MFLIRKINRYDNEFYPMLGPIFGSRKAAKEIGINVYDDGDKDFYIAQAGGIGIAGCLSVRGLLVSDCYVYPEWRRQGALRAMLTMATLADLKYRANCTEMSLGAFVQQGFKPLRATKNFTYVEKNA